MRRGWAGEAMHGSNSSSLGTERVLVFSLGPLEREIRMAVTPATVKVQVLGLCPLPPTRFWGRRCGPHPGFQEHGLLEPGSVWWVGLDKFKNT